MPGMMTSDGANLTVEKQIRQLRSRVLRKIRYDKQNVEEVPVPMGVNPKKQAGGSSRIWNDFRLSIRQRKYYIIQKHSDLHIPTFDRLEFCKTFVILRFFTNKTYENGIGLGAREPSL